MGLNGGTSLYLNGLPSFMIFSPITQEVTINEAALGDIGEYEIRILATLNNLRRTQAFVNFRVVVKCIPTDFGIDGGL